MSAGRSTFHLAPAELWSDAEPAAALPAPSLQADGFIHCTTGADEMVATANRHYRADPRDFVVLTIDLDRVTSPVRTDDPGGIYPHIFGPIDRAAILAARPMPRAADGTFLAFDDASEG
ncbi:MAG TPA: DUF952 domain-containing protein [Candidatus Limnocylindrales bacterium]|nr:DUF952 domain-containing protein [Candidatus Limnocylindrales bacterium]